MIGQTISHYEIVSKLGGGGMGVVYEARDLKLHRLVALKFLPQELCEDEAVKLRFTHEARAASALDHPNICTVYDIDETADGRMFIVMARYAGETLKQKIQRGPLPLTEALDYGIQIAQGLTKAHQQGIVHRDIKPANVMVTEDGAVKIVDFGLAQLGDATKLTKTGLSMGTPAYMSPEQVQRQQVDRRTDLWSLGVVLYEMIAGRVPFPGELDAAVAYAILHTDPEPPTGLRTGVPMDLDRIVRKAMARSPAERYQHAEDISIDLEACRRNLAAGHSRAGRAAIDRKRTSPTFILAGSAVLLAVLGLGWWLGRSPEEVPAPPPGYSLRQITRDEGLTYQPALAPSGELLAYASDRSGDGNLDVWVQQLGAGNPIRLTDHETDDYMPSFSADGSQIVFQSNRDGGGIYVVPALGGTVRRVSESSNLWTFTSTPSRFSPDGKWISCSVGWNDSANRAFHRLLVFPASGGAPREISSGLARANAGVWSPDSSRLLISGSAEPGGFGVYPDNDWWLAPVEGANVVRLEAAKIFAEAGIVAAAGDGGYAFPRPQVWLADGNRVLFDGAIEGGATNLWQIRIDPNTLRLVGVPERLTSGTGETSPSASKDGRIAFTNFSRNWDIWRVPLNADQSQVTGPLEAVVTGLSDETYPTVSADGTKLAYISDRAGNQDVWLRDVVTGEDRPVTASRQREIRAAVSPDGSRIGFARREADRVNLYVCDSSGSSERKILETIGNIMNWLPGSKRILLYSTAPIRWITIDVETGQTEELAIKHPEYPVHDVQLSPDGRWVSFKLFTGPRHGPMFIAPYEGQPLADQNQWVAVADKLWNSRNWWSPDGRTLYFLSYRDGFGCIWMQRLDPVTTKPTGEPTALQHLHGVSQLAEPNRFGFGMASDRLYLSLGGAKGNIWLAEPQ